jgi:UDP-2,4-diacetamido-2,4,6-trideoxy-beta-L-altropyranose hydrolase
MRIAIRVDASQTIGTGHVRRSLALAQAVAALGGEVRFVTRDLGIDSTEMIAAAGFGGSVLLPAPKQAALPDPCIPHSHWAEVSSARDVADTCEALAAFRPDWTVLDSYAFDARWHNGVRAQIGCQIAQIDDLADRALACDLLIDHNFAPDTRAKYAAVLPASARLLGGPRFALLGPAFAQAKRYDFHKNVRSIGVFMGGVDAGEHSLAVLDAIAMAGFEGAVEVVATSANPHLAALRKRVKARPGTALSIDLPDLAAFFARHDLQIGAGGGASWERCCIGVPTLLVVVAPNQMSVAPFLAGAGFADFAADPATPALAAKISALIADAPRRARLAGAARALVDGQGSARSALALMGASMTMRPATTGDAQMMFDWRGDAATQAVSRDRGALVWEDHLTWLSCVLDDPARKLLVGEIGGRPVGIIRFDIAGADLPRGLAQGPVQEAVRGVVQGPAQERAEVSLYLDPALHGLGLGKHLLLAGEDAADPAVVDAAVLAGNHASHRLFTSCGYDRTGPGTYEKRRLPAPRSPR